MAAVYNLLSAESYLEFAFLRWILNPAVKTNIVERITPQFGVNTGEHSYRLDYAIAGSQKLIAIELDGFEFHGNRQAFTYDRLRQNDLQAANWSVIRFSYDSIRLEPGRCVFQLQSILKQDPLLATYVIPDPIIEQPIMEADSLFSLAPSPFQGGNASAPFISGDNFTGYFDAVRHKLSLIPLRECQIQAFSGLANYYSGGGQNAACVMSVGAGKTALGVVSCLAFTRKRALILTPGSVIRGTFDRALDQTSSKNVLYALPKGPLIPGSPAPKVLTLDRDDQPIKNIPRANLLKADIIVTNFHSLGTGQDPNDLLAKLNPDDIDFIIVDEAHIAAAESYQRTFNHFKNAKTLLMSACFQRLDGKPIEADVVYRYRLIDSIAEGNAKKLRIQRFAPEVEETIYELALPDGTKEEVVGREALLGLVGDERKLSHITAKSETSIKHVLQATKKALDKQAEVLYPIRPRVLFSALGELHAEQIAKLACEFGIPADYLHYSMPDNRIRSIRNRFEQESGDLQGIVQLKMLGQGYDFPPITIVVPMRPYGSFSEFYQFIGRGIRVINDPSLSGRVTAGDQVLDVVYHAEMNLDDQIETIYRENDMDLSLLQAAFSEEPITDKNGPESESGTANIGNVIEGSGTTGGIGSSNNDPNVLVVFEQGSIEQRVIHDEKRVEQRKVEREREALAQRYAVYAQSTSKPVSFEEFVTVMKRFSK